jgi:hypothetical protein
MRLQSETCIIPRTVEIAANEIALERALVVMVTGTWPVLTPSDVQAYIMGHFGLPSVVHGTCAPPRGLPCALSGL